MERQVLQKSNSQPNFIGSWVMQPISMCDDLTDYFESHPEKQKRGLTVGGLDPASKNCVDMTILPNEINQSGNDIFKKYFQCLFDCHKDYISQWPFLENLAEKLEIGSFNLQRYQSGEHFQTIHAERTSLNTLHRVLAWMTYLNDVNEGGSTYFSHYDIEIQPRKGLTLIWPADWTHAHKGNVVKGGCKYIITGWMSFPD